MDLERIEKLICFEAVGKYDYVRFDRAVPRL